MTGRRMPLLLLLLKPVEMLRFPGDAMAALSFSDDVMGTLGFSGEAMAMLDFFDVDAVVVLVGAVFFT